MQALVEIVDRITCSFRRIFLMLSVTGIIIALILFAGVQSIAPVVANEVGERAERFGEQAIAQAAEERRARDLAREGWGYPAEGSGSASGRHQGAERGPNGNEVGGWGSE